MGRLTARFCRDPTVQCQQAAAVEHICKEPGGLFICEHVLRVRNAEVVLAEDTAFEPVIVFGELDFKIAEYIFEFFIDPAQGMEFHIRIIACNDSFFYCHWIFPSLSPVMY